MIRKLLAFILIINLTACAELQEVVNNLPQSSGTISNADIASGLRQALNLGIDKQVSKLTQKDGFFKNDLVKILLPDDLKKVDKGLRDIGLSIGVILAPLLCSGSPLEAQALASSRRSVLPPGFWKDCHHRNSERDKAIFKLPFQQAKNPIGVILAPLLCS